MPRLTLIASVALSLLGARAGNAQASQDAVSRHRIEYDAVQRDFSHFRRVGASMDTLGLEQQSTDGGMLTAYCDGSTLRLLVADYYGETGDMSERYYFVHDSLFFVLQQSRRGIPDGHAYPRRTIFETTRYYFTDDRLIRWLGSNGKAQRIDSPDARTTAEEFLNDARRYGKLMAGCKPKYTPVPQ